MAKAIDPADELWQRIVDDVRQRLGDKASAEWEFHAAMGIAATEASEAELRAYLDRPRVDEDTARTDASHHIQTVQQSPGVDRPGWLAVAGGGLSQPLEVKIAIVAGRPRVVALRIDNGREITARTLREIRLGAVIDDWLAGWDPNDPPASSDVDEIEPWIAMDRWVRDLNDVPDFAGENRARKGTPPSDEVLRSFARVYLKHFRLRPRGAISRAAQDVPIARSTAYRWLELCRERGFVPPSEESS